MGIKLVSVKCPECGATLNLEENRREAFCTYCGSKVIVSNENEHIYRHIDEAEIKQAETDRLVQMKKIEFADKVRVSREKKLKLKIIISLVLATIGILMMAVGGVAGSASGDSDSAYYMISLLGFFPLMGAAYIWLFHNEENDDNDFGDKIRMPSAIDGFEKKSYEAIQEILKNAGFTNITCVSLHDLTVGLLKRPGAVESITVNGRKIDSGGKKYLPDAKIIISYHSR